MSHPLLGFVMSEPKRVDFKPSWMKDPGNDFEMPPNGSVPPVEYHIGKVTEGMRVKHLSSGREYMVHCLVKTCNDEEWVDGVMYINSNGEAFVQPLERFRRKFEVIE